MCLFVCDSVLLWLSSQQPSSLSLSLSSAVVTGTLHRVQLYLPQHPSYSGQLPLTRRLTARRNNIHWKKNWGKRSYNFFLRLVSHGSHFRTLTAYSLKSFTRRNRGCGSAVRTFAALGRPRFTFQGPRGGGRPPRL